MFEIGDTGTYILEQTCNYKIHYLCDIPKSAAVVWVCESDQIHHRFSDGRVLPRMADGIVYNWLNKRFYIVSESIDGNLIAVFNYDENYKVYKLVDKR